MKGKIYFNEIKKEICLHQLFSKLHNYFPTKSSHTSIHFLQRCTSFRKPSLKNWRFVFETISSLQTSPYPASYCTHINTLITTNHFLTAHFTLPTVLLYSHQHTDHHFLTAHFTLPSTSLYSHQHTDHHFLTTHFTLPSTLLYLHQHTDHHFLTTHFILPTILLYSHQHTDHHKGLAFVCEFQSEELFPLLRIQ